MTTEFSLSILPDFCRHFLDRLKRSLPAHLYYHSAEHTIDVIKEAYSFACHDQLSQKETELLLIAATFHDAGFLYPQEGDEEVGARMAAKAMKEAGTYSNDEIADVITAIMDTKLFIDEKANSAIQVPTSKLSKYLLDADMSNLGRDDFFTKAELVAKEHEKSVTDPNFHQQMRRVCQSKIWHSPAGITLRQPKHLENLKKLSTRG